MPTDTELRVTAEAQGIQQEFWDGLGIQHITTAETNAEILAAIGGNPDNTGDSPVWVIGENDPLPLPGTVTTEDGEELENPAKLPWGYHELRTPRGTSRLIVTPDSAQPPPKGRCTGLGVMLHGVRSERNWGCGDFRDLSDLIDWAVPALGADFIALNPLHAIHNRRPFNTSPYLPNSIFHRNFLYIDVEGVAGFEILPHDDADEAERALLRAAPDVQYEPVAALKRKVLEQIFVLSPPNREALAWIASEGEVLRLYATYSALDEHIHGANPNIWGWPDWPMDFQSPDSPAVQEFTDGHANEILFHGWLQWLIDQQLATVQRHARAKGMSIGLYHDLALAVDRFGADLWAWRDFFIPGCRVGAPPDDFSPTGQDWGFPPPNSSHHREDGYRLFALSIRKSLRHGGALRIDHVMRLFRLYWIPPGKDATQGAYVQDRGEELVRILALESRRAGAVIIGEDLGTVEPVVRETLTKFGILSYRLLYFERDGTTFRPPALYPPLALVSTTTHDLPTIAGFWTGRDITAREAAGTLSPEAAHAQREARDRDRQNLLDALRAGGLLPVNYPTNAPQIPELTGELHYAIMGWLAGTPAALWLVNQEDLTKESSQQNVPGTTSTYPNWSRKMPYSMEELRTLQVPRDCAAMIRWWSDGRRAAS